MNRSQLFSQAHAAARTNSAAISYRAKFAAALTAAYAAAKNTNAMKNTITIIYLGAEKEVETSSLRRLEFVASSNQEALEIIKKIESEKAGYIYEDSDQVYMPVFVDGNKVVCMSWFTQRWLETKIGVQQKTNPLMAGEHFDTTDSSKFHNE